MVRGFIVFIISLFGVLSSHAVDCSGLLGTCQYYQCLEIQEKCGKDGYYLEFGAKYCRKYQADHNEYTERGREFLVHIRECLQDELDREIHRAGELPKCSKVKNFAVETHKSCYSQYRFCDLPDSDKLRIKLTAKYELLDFQLLKFAFWLEKSCY